MNGRHSKHGLRIMLFQKVNDFFICFFIFVQPRKYNRHLRLICVSTLQDISRTAFLVCRQFGIGCPGIICRDLTIHTGIKVFAELFYTIETEYGYTDKNHSCSNHEYKNTHARCGPFKFLLVCTFHLQIYASEDIAKVFSNRSRLPSDPCRIHAFRFRTCILATPYT